MRLSLTLFLLSLVATEQPVSSFIVNQSINSRSSCNNNNNANANANSGGVKKSYYSSSTVFVRQTHYQAAVQQNAASNNNNNNNNTSEQEEEEGATTITTTTTTTTTNHHHQDEGEWKAVLSAFKMYKAAYGDLKVPSRFVVPSMPPWPEAAWGMRLGTKVASIRSAGKYVYQNEDRRKALNNIGFLWRLRSPRTKEDDTTAGNDVLDTDGLQFNQIYDALVAYKKENGDLNIPIGFVVPEVDPYPENTRGLPLGQKLDRLRSKSFGKDRPDQANALKELGLEMNGKTAANDVRYRNVYNALAKYKEINGDLLVPQPFVVPEEKQWPQDLWGLRLGARVNAIRSQGTFVNTNPDRREELTELGFLWEIPTEEGSKRRGRRKKESPTFDESLKDMMENAIGGDTDGAGSTSSPEDDLFASLFGTSTTTPESVGPSSPSDAFGMRAQPETASSLAAGMYKSSNGETKKGSVPPVVNQPIGSAASDMLFVNVQEMLEQDLEVLKDVQLEDVWPFLTPDEQDDIKAKTVDKGKVAWTFDDYGGFEIDDIVEALKFYKSVYNDFDVHVDFVVPFYDQDAAAASAALASLDDETDDSDVEEELTQAQSQVAWPSKYEGMDLGMLVARMREGDVEFRHIPELKEKFDSIGFDWGDEEKYVQVPFEKAICALWVFYQIRGTSCVPLDFTIPDDEPWPEALAGYPLGKVTDKIRLQKDMFENEFFDKWRMLHMLEFIWLPSIEGENYTYYELMKEYNQL